MENSRIAGAKRRLAVAKRLMAGVAAVAFGVTFVAIRSGGAATSNTAVNQTQTQTPTKTQTQATTDNENDNEQNFFGSSSVGSPSGAAPSVSSSTS
jgi:carbohydrate-binding DOMON domain-containing protein